MMTPDDIRALIRFFLLAGACAAAGAGLGHAGVAGDFAGACQCGALWLMAAAMMSHMGR